MKNFKEYVTEGYPGPFDNYEKADQFFRDKAHELGNNPIQMFGQGDANKYRTHVMKHVKTSRFAGSDTGKSIKTPFKEEALSEGEGDYEVKWTDRKYQTIRKVFKNDPKGPPGNAETAARKHMRAIIASHDKSKYGVIRGPITINGLEEAFVPDPRTERLNTVNSAKAKAQEIMVQRRKEQAHADNHPDRDFDNGDDSKKARRREMNEDNDSPYILGRKHGFKGAGNNNPHPHPSKEHTSYNDGYFDGVEERKSQANMNSAYRKLDARVK